MVALRARLGAFRHPPDPLPRQKRPAEGSTAVSGVVAYNRYGGYLVPHASWHRPAARAILEGRVWEPDTLAHILAVQPRHVVHAGTYFGDFLPALASVAERVWAFEPSSENHRCAAATLAINGLVNVELTNAALGARSGTAGLATIDADGRPLGGGSHLVDGDGDLSVRVVALDDVIEDDAPVDLVHLDVEGHEEQALTGAQRLLTRCRPVLVLETVPDAWVAEHLAPLGYRPVARLDVNTVLAPDEAGTV